MTYLTVKKRPQGSMLHYCDTPDCRKHNMGGGRREATHIMWICGRATYLCRGCASSMAQAYQSALERESEAVAA